MDKPRPQIDILKEDVFTYLKLYKNQTSNEIIKKLKSNFNVCPIRVENITPILTLIFDEKRIKDVYFEKKGVGLFIITFISYNKGKTWSIIDDSDNKECYIKNF